jgi:hypothetical protein
MQPNGKNDDRRRGMKAEGAAGAARAHPPPTRAGLVGHALEAGTQVVTLGRRGGIEVHFRAEWQLACYAA